MAKCNKCGRSIPDGEKYCVSCKETQDHSNKNWLKGLGSVMLSIVGIVILLTTGGKGGNTKA